MPSGFHVSCDGQYVGLILGIGFQRFDFNVISRRVISNGGFERVIRAVRHVEIHIVYGITSLPPPVPGGQRALYHDFLRNTSTFLKSIQIFRCGISYPALPAVHRPRKHPEFQYNSTFVSHAFLKKSYTQDQSYILTITRNVESRGGQRLKNEIKLKFKV